MIIVVAVLGYFAAWSLVALVLLAVDAVNSTQEPTDPFAAVELLGVVPYELTPLAREVLDLQLWAAEL